MKWAYILFISLIGALLFIGCKSAGIFGKRTPHQLYEDKLKKAKLDQTTLGKKWLSIAEISLEKPITISLPFAEKGYFAAEDPEAVTYEFTAKRGQRIYISCSIKSDSSVLVFLDLFKGDNTEKTFLKALEIIGDTLIETVKQDSKFLVRVQPELLRNVEYFLTITTGPSIVFPVDSSGKPTIISFWGALASVNGYAKIANNRLGGKAVFVYDAQNSFSLYYAHLDSQMVQNGQLVKAGDTIGLIGNTGNARGTVPHLHFGIYTSHGAINPIEFINPVEKQPPGVIAPEENIGKWLHVTSNTPLYSFPKKDKINELRINEPAFVLGAMSSYYRVLLFNGMTGYAFSKNFSSSPVSQKEITEGSILFDYPKQDAIGIMRFDRSQNVNIIGRIDSFSLVKSGSVHGWIKR